MADKKKWTAIDTVIVILVIVAAAAAYKVLGNKSLGGEKRTIEAVVMVTNQDPALADAMTIGDTVTLSLTEKDSGVLKDINAVPARVMAYNAIDGEYNFEEAEGRIDLYATVEVEVEESDLAFSIGSTQLKVGSPIPFRGKGYATEGYVTEIHE